MNNIDDTGRCAGTTPIAVSIAAILLAACATTPPPPDGSAAARSKLTQLEANPELATRAQAAMKEADLAVRAAELPQKDPVVKAHLVYIADRKIDIAAAQANTKLTEDQRQSLTQERDKARLSARTQEADRNARQLADQTAVTAAANDKSAELQRQLDAMNAKPTDRGMVLTLGDVLFTTGQADLKGGATTNLNKLVAFLNDQPDRTVVVEGHTDSVGGDAYNVALSQRRAEAVKSFLTGQGINSTRVTTLGKGKSDPVAENESATGRQQNRRVEVIISNSVAAAK